MCGILGIAGAYCPQEVKTALRLIAHRGPDGSGVFADSSVTLGHRRLSIIDVVGGAQPFKSRDGRYVLTFVGEIYNYRELARRLRESDINFVSNSDTEVLLYWLIEHGRDGLADLNGMFAFALWDTVEKSLLLARDRLGIKQLYFMRSHGRMIFSSEIKAILPWMDAVRPNSEAIFQFLTMQLVIDDQTFFTGVSKLPPGSWMIWTGGEITKGKYWEVSINHESDISHSDAVAMYQDKLTDAVSRHLVSDVPVGSYLSSGIDSSSVAATAREQLSGPFHTFTGAFHGAGSYYDERPGAEAVAKQLGSDHHETMIGPDDYLRDIGNVMWHLEEPTVGAGALPHYRTAELAAKNVKVVLTGHGGDELFGGYQVNKAAFLRQTLAKNPVAALGQLAQFRRDEWTRIMYFLVFPFVYPEVRHGMFVMTPKKKRHSQLSPDFLGLQTGTDPFESLDRIVPREQRGTVDGLMYLYLKSYLPSLFIQEDKVAMAHSLEARIPLCDHSLIDFASKLGPANKLFGGRLKAVPRAAMSGKIPAILFSLPKRGFPTPYAQWYRQNPLKEFMADLLVSKNAMDRGIFQKEYLLKLWNTHISGRGDMLLDYARAHRIYSMSMIELWFRTFVDSDPLTDRFPHLRVGIYAYAKG